MDFDSSQSWPIFIWSLPPKDYWHASCQKGFPAKELLHRSQQKRCAFPCFLSCSFRTRTCPSFRASFPCRTLGLSLQNNSLWNSIPRSAHGKLIPRTPTDVEKNKRFRDPRSWGNAGLWKWRDALFFSHGFLSSRRGCLVLECLPVLLATGRLVPAGAWALYVPWPQQ